LHVISVTQRIAKTDECIFFRSFAGFIF